MAKQEDKSILEMCLALHMHITGASDPLPSEVYNEYFHYLVNKFENWQDGLLASKLFDDSVKQLVSATLYECNTR